MVNWHQRYLQQARWTKELRSYLYSRVGLLRVQSILEVGCGTGVLAAELNGLAPHARISGLDLQASVLVQARGYAKTTTWVQGDAHMLPFPPASFDLALCHFLLLWVRDPLRVVMEMKRVTRPGGSLLVLAEPDYGGRIDYPADLAALGEAQRKSLQRQGADPLIGRRLGEILTKAGLVEIETGVIGGLWRGAPASHELEMEWAVLSSDLAGEFSPAELAYLRAQDEAAYQAGSRILYVPTFYGWGKVPQ
jgi:SAM-dependent methyltransferase